ncbi:hypothetical protein J4458_06885 [Candidatus Woesearchaeota archaeon]|nr:hypothetical protein [Candidatus Woesearchaeota archaeon]
MEQKDATLAAIVSDDDSTHKIKSIKIDINKYIIELIRISESYKFELQVKPKAEKNEKAKENALSTISLDAAGGINADINKAKTWADDAEEAKQYKFLNFHENAENAEVFYENDAKLKKHEEYKIEAKLQTKNTRYQELWEKEGFYQEKTYLAKVKVQLWPKHLPYDHLKEKRAFLFC